MTRSELSRERLKRDAILVADLMQEIESSIYFLSLQVYKMGVSGSVSREEVLQQDTHARTSGARSSEAIDEVSPCQDMQLWQTTAATIIQRSWRHRRHPGS